MDLFHHKMLKAALFCCFRIPFDLYEFFLNLIAIQIVKGRSSFCQSSNLHISNIVDTSCILKNCRHIGGNKTISVCHSDDHRAVFSRHINFFRIFFKHQCQCVRTANTHHRMVNRIHWCMLIFFIIIVHQFHRHFGIRRRIKTISFFQKLRL